jgi:hypothetical protein
VWLLKFVPDTGQVTEFVDVFLCDSIVAAGILEGNGISWRQVCVDRLVREFDVFFIRCVGQVVDLAEESEMVADSFFQ